MRTIPSRALSGVLVAAGLYFVGVHVVTTPISPNSQSTTQAWTGIWMTGKQNYSATPV
ncbi:hypothetical protein ACIHEI_32700 [Kitasatospora sp. NPDC051984]|uniref:hypothetical protein n=1 Tax=Kitasatospora sp. NPDC051984 TaxID=3364059 RepID=UPI0037C74366